jgi:alkanesulfonate monooxygenase SsuD/methylene tetrahydromethanopterin reductase-like flavin-dependent oxidoreductase (luciferase family)
MMAKTIAAYRGAQDASLPTLTRVRNDRVGAYTLVHCTDDPEEAAGYGLWDSVTWWYKHLAEFTLEWELPNFSQEDRDRMFPLLKLSADSPVDTKRYQDEDMIIIGTPEMCLEKILRYDEAGVDQLLCYMQFGSLPHEKVMRSLELMATRIIPELEKRGHRVDATTVA